VTAQHNLLGEIYAAMRRRAVEDEFREPALALRSRALKRIEDRRSLLTAVRDCHGPAIIGELKPASPLRRQLIRQFDPAAIARDYAATEIVAISVLTEPLYFRGNLLLLPLVRELCDRPILRKDFLTTPYQVVQSAAYGADAVLLIARMLTEGELHELLEEARRWQLEVLLEVHTQRDMTFVRDLNVPLIGINNRDLDTLEVDIRITERLLPLVPPGVTVVSESGLRAPFDVARLFRAGVKGFLVGEALMREPHRAAFVRSLRTQYV